MDAALVLDLQGAIRIDAACHAGFRSIAALDAYGAIGQRIRGAILGEEGRKARASELGERRDAMFQQRGHQRIAYRPECRRGKVR